MKRLISLVFLLSIFPLTLIGGCTKNNNYEVRVTAMRGLTMMGLAHVSEESISINVATEISEVSVDLKQGNIDVAVIPSNAAATLFTKAEIDIVVKGITVENGLYIMEKGNTITDITSLNGKKIISTGKGAVPEYALKAVLEFNGVEPSEIDLYQTPAEVIAQMKVGGTIALLPKPFTDVAAAQIDGLRYALDLGKEFEEMDLSTGIVTAVVVARRSFLTSNKDAFSFFMNVYRESVDFMTDKNNSTVAAQHTVDLGIVPSLDIAKKVFESDTGITLITEDLKLRLESFYNLLLNYNSASIGGALPANSFYAVQAD